MSVVSSLQQRLVEPERRRTVRLTHPWVQVKLALYLLVTSLAFAALMAFVGWSAYGRLIGGSLEAAAAPYAQDVIEQTRPFVRSSLALLAGYVLVVLAVTIAYLHRVTGPIVAFERHLRALGRGDYHSRVALRRDDRLYGRLAALLNELASRLESGRGR